MTSQDHRGDIGGPPSVADAPDRLIRAALADVDAGRIIDHRDVQAWADSLGTDRPLPFPRPR